MGSGGGKWDAGDPDSAARKNQKQWLCDTGANISGFSSPLAGMHAYCTTSGSGFVAKHEYVYDGSNWIDVTGFREIGRTELGSNGTSISVASLLAYKHLRIWAQVNIVTNTVGIGIRFNNDSGNNYATRYTTNGAADLTDVSASSIYPRNATEGVGNSILITADISNEAAGVYKAMIGHYVDDNAQGGGASIYPNKIEFVAKWADTSAQITRIDLVRVAGSGNYATGSRLIVFGMN